MSISNRLTGQQRQQQTCAPAPRPPGRRADPTWSTRRTYLVDASHLRVVRRSTRYCTLVRIARGSGRTLLYSYMYLVDASHLPVVRRGTWYCTLVRIARGSGRILLYSAALYELVLDLASTARHTVTSLNGYGAAHGTVLSYGSHVKNI